MASAFLKIVLLAIFWGCVDKGTCHGRLGRLRGRGAVACIRECSSSTYQYCGNSDMWPCHLITSKSVISDGPCDTCWKCRREKECVSYGLRPTQPSVRDCCRADPPGQNLRFLCELRFCPAPRPPALPNDLLPPCCAPCETYHFPAGSTCCSSLICQYIDPFQEEPSDECCMCRSNPSKICCDPGACS